MQSRCNQEAIKRPSRGHQDAIKRQTRGNQEAIERPSRGDQEAHSKLHSKRHSDELISRHQTPSDTNRHNQTQSDVISRNQTSSHLGEHSEAGLGPPAVRVMLSLRLRAALTQLLKCFGLRLERARRHGKL